MAGSPPRQPAAVFTLENRKYIGSKTRLLFFLQAEIQQRAEPFDTFGDLFAGTGVVGHAFAERGKRVVAVDNLYSNYVGLVTFLCPEPSAGPDRLRQRVDELNGLPAISGYCQRHFGDRYFTAENAGRIDAIREQIAAWQRSGETTSYEHCALLTALLYAADKAANTVGQYDAFLKHLGGPAYSAEGRHLVDQSAYRSLQLLPPAVGLPPGGHQAFCGDAEELAARLAVDVLYLDPPYNSRQYVDNYHVLENIARWEQPPVFGQTHKFDRTYLKSRFSSLRAVRAALQSVIARAQARHLFLSYNSEGLLTHEELLALLQPFGPVTVMEADYSVFGNGAGKSRKRRVVERLYHLQKR